MNCYNCKQPGHIANNCKASKKECNPDIKCEVCGKKGHKLSNCYSRKINFTAWCCDGARRHAQKKEKI